jgi:hypothetical protein
MKFALILVFLCSGAFASEVSTDCSAMNSSRETKVKETVTKKGKAIASQIIAQ